MKTIIRITLLILFSPIIIPTIALACFIKPDLVKADQAMRDTCREMSREEKIMQGKKCK